ncbi:phage terminase large subunit family protein, partial [Haemophilus influenzae]|nr:phage terminase large subunit family protein [Haemophilus influenzae]
WGDEDNVPYWAKLPSVNPNVIRKESSAPEEAESAVEIEQVKPQPKPKPKSNWLNGGASKKKGGWL